LSALAARAAALLGAGLAGEERLHGGDLSQVVRVALSDGRSVVAKAAATALAEAGMLRAIAAAGTPAPRVLAADRGILVMQDLGRDEGPSAAWADLGSALRRLHSATGADYGWAEDHGFGPVPIPNAPLPNWPAFWAERRLLACCPALPPALVHRVEALAGRLADLLPSAPPPALLHGDLWTGNVMAREGRVTGLIDPACYHGHAEVDLAMLALFGTPGPAFRDTYGAPHPGEAARRPLYQLWPALVHLRLFGQGYLGLVERCLLAAERA
jgi:fructosamine-3-kinase